MPVPLEPFCSYHGRMMTRQFIFFGGIVIALAAAALMLSCFSDGDTVAILSVHDGDSFRVKHQDGRSVAVRLYGVDCPELGQPYGAEARDVTRRLVGRRRPGPKLPGAASGPMPIPFRRGSGAR